MRRIFAVAAVVASAVLVMAATKKTVTKTVTKSSARHGSSVARGEYLVRTSGCADCHTPQKFDPTLGMPVPDESRAFSGQPTNGPDPEGTLGPHDQAIIGPTFSAFKLPFGTVYAANLTPDKQTGLGAWTAEQFIQTLRTGHVMGSGRPILPPMPWPDFAKLSDADLHAMFDYLHSIKPIHNAVPAPKVPPEVIQHIGESMQKMMNSAH